MKHSNLWVKHWNALVTYDSNTSADHSNFLAKRSNLQVEDSNFLVKYSKNLYLVVKKHWTVSVKKQ